MSNLERDPSELVIAGGTGAVATTTPSGSVEAGSATAGARTAPGDTADAPGPVILLLPRDVPLGGPRAMNVRRTLPQRGRSTIGAWCFIDHYGPDEIAPVAASGAAPAWAPAPASARAWAPQATAPIPMPQPQQRMPAAP